MRQGLAPTAFGVALCCALCAADASAGQAGRGDDPFADVVVDYQTGANPVPGFTTAEAALGPPQRFTGEGFDPMVVSPFNPPWRPDEVVSIGAGGSLTLMFDAPVTNDPANPFGIDLLIFGNALLVDGTPQDGVCPVPAQLLSEGGTVELSADGNTWVTVPDGVADGLFPTIGWLDVADPYATEPGSAPADFTVPVDPSLTLAEFDGASYDAILQLYRGSGGGAGVDIGALGLTEVRFVRITNAPGNIDTPEIDAVADVAPRITGDATGDGTVDVFDLLELLAHWGAAHPTGWHAELTDDDVINVFDLLELLANWGAES